MLIVEFAECEEFEIVVRLQLGGTIAFCGQQSDRHCVQSKQAGSCSPLLTDPSN